MTCTIWPGEDKQYAEGTWGRPVVDQTDPDGSLHSLPVPHTELQGGVSTLLNEEGCPLSFKEWFLPADIVKHPPSNINCIIDMLRPITLQEVDLGKESSSLLSRGLE